MFDLVVIDTAEWRLSIGFGGFGKVKARDSSGKFVYASRAEKNVLQDLLRELVHRKLPNIEFESVKENIAGDFCCALFENNEIPGMSMVYRIVFGNHPIPEVVGNYIAANEKYGRTTSKF